VPPTTPQPTAELLRLWRSLSPRRKVQAVGVMGLSVLASFAELLSIGAIIPFLAALTNPELLFAQAWLQPLLARLGITEPGQLLLPLALAFAKAVVLAGVVRIVVQWASVKLSLAIGHDMVSNIFHRTLHQPYTVHIQRNTSEVIDGIVLKVERVIGSVITPMVGALTSVFTLLVVLLAVVVFQPIVALGIIFGLGAIYGVIYWLTHGRLVRDGLRAAKAATARMQVLQEGLGGIRDILLDGTHATFGRRFNEADLILRRVQVRATVISVTPRFMVEALGMALIAMVAFFMLQTQDGSAVMAVPILGGLALAAQRMLPMVQNIYTAWSLLSGNTGYLREVLALVEQPEPQPNASSKPPTQTPAALLHFSQSIELHNVSFAYNASGPQVLRNVNLSIAKGARIGIVGSTGSGKSTLMDIILGLLPPSAGELRIDGLAINTQQARAHWQSHVAHVPQAMFLADASVAANIAFGTPEPLINHARVQDAARRAQIANTIESWEHGYATLVGERGVRLSGGQRQRLAIARALYKQADVLVFDEATSALDDDTEDAVLQAIEALGPELTIILITHRPRPLRAMHAVWRVEGGMVHKQA